MKHSYRVTLILLFTFLLAQFVGLGVVYNYIDFDSSTDNQTVFKALPFGERPEVEEQTSFIPLLIAILLGTGLLLLLIKFNLTWIWKAWFFIAVLASLFISFNAFIPLIIAFSLALLFTIWKILKPGFLIQTGTELFIYGGLAAIIVPLLNVMSVSILMVLIAIYDAYAVWKSKHMITLAKSQAKAKIFAGLLIPYRETRTPRKISLKKITSFKVKNLLTRIKKAKKKLDKHPKKIRTAMLGGGDIGFPLIFAGVLLKDMGLWQALIIPFFAAAGLSYLLFFSDEKKFYPAMPFIGAACFVGLGLIYLIQLL
ncbi:hypothetical protein HOE52_04435 [Candidatus Woesearchaeota archaeon]|nr:hypothetical protein [Candidatus Woesearchaeota archaeon]